MPFPASGDLPDAGMEPESLGSPTCQADSLPPVSGGKPPWTLYTYFNLPYQMLGRAQTHPIVPDIMPDTQ